MVAAVELTPQERLAAQVYARARLARASLPEFGEFVFGWPCMSHHRMWCDALDDGDLWSRPARCSGASGRRDSAGRRMSLVDVDGSDDADAPFNGRLLTGHKTFLFLDKIKPIAPIRATTPNPGMNPSPPPSSSLFSTFTVMLTSSE